MTDELTQKRRKMVGASSHRPAASRLAVIRLLGHGVPRCPSGRTMMKFRWLLHRALKHLHATRARRYNRREAKKSPSSGRGGSLHSRRWESLSSRRRDSPSSRQSRSRRWRRQDLHPRAWGSTPRPRLGARVGNASSRNCIGRPNHKYPCLGVTLLSFHSFFGD